ncbi:tail fiber domain-containing protein [Pantoea agglomerans]|uniref:tail fiber domain-containing protein n=1 Tax=Enterobacter agglomerans TaxID=549 RepID=UPI003C7DB0D6
MRAFSCLSSGVPNMATGSLTVTNKSKTITGTGTAFADELARGDFIVFSVGAVTYTLPVNAINGDDEISLAKPYNGPSADGLPFVIIPLGTSSNVTMELVAQVTEALRGLNGDKKNWQAVFSEDAEITVVMPDGSEFTGPSWLQIVNAVKEAGGDDLITAVEEVRAAVQSVADDKASVEKTVTDAKADITDTIATGKEDMQAIADAAAASAEAAAGSEDAAADSLAAATKQAHAASDSAKGAQESATTATSAATAAKNQADRATEEADKLGNWNDLATALDSVDDKDVKWKGALEVGREAAKDSELVTLRQLVSATVNGGSGGPTMNGVMNNTLGAPVWFNGSRAKIWPGHQPADGQIAKRADFPEIWAAVKAGIFTSVDNETWQADWSKRAAYSDGDGETTFRFPDLNGFQPTSLDGPFLRGDGGGNLTIGAIQANAAPNITGTFSLHAAELPNIIASASGALAQGDLHGQYRTPSSLPGPNNGATSSGNLTLDASRSNGAYGRNSNEVRPNAAVGIWIIRTSGIFNAQDTNFNVIIADENLPDSGAVVYGGAVQSVYQAEGNDKLTARLRSKYTVGGKRSAVIDVVDNTGDKLVSSVWELSSDGILKAPTTTLKSEDVATKTLRIRDTAAAASTAELNIGFKAGDVSQVITNYTSNVKKWDFNGLEINGAGIMRSFSGFEGAAITGGLLNQSGGTIRSSIRDNNQFGTVRANFDFWTRCDSSGARQGVLRVHTDNFSGEQNWIFSQVDGRVHGSAGTLAIDTSSDARLKTVDGESDLEAAAARIDALRFVDYHWNDHQFNVQRKVSQDEQQHGVIAQEAQKVDPRYVRTTQQQIGGIEDGHTEEILNLNTDAMLLDAMATIQMMRKEMADLKKQLAALKAKA